ncbi:MAG: glycerophosphodiester phosphodiesterase [Clostridia bacterium]|nr:glycerophosphodiester phosphodiesterase [Clostridia bacterium]
MNSKFPLPKGFTITAHTGCEGTEYNSAESIRVGSRYGEIVEVDLNFTKNGDPVLAHTFAKKDSLSLDEAFSVLSELPGTKMNIDVKIGPNLKAVYDCAIKYGVQDRILYTGIEKEKLVSAKRDTPEIPFYLNVTVTRFKMLRKGYIDYLVEETKKHGAIGLNMSYKPCTKALIDAFHKKGLIVSLYTCNSEKAMLKALNLGADNITTRNPKKLKSLIEE